MNWLDGEPCVNGWYGVYCCPESNPYLYNAQSLDPSQQHCTSYPQGTARRRLVHETTNATRNDVKAVFEDGTHFCHYGSWHGNDTDLARCVVVQILLNNNNLSGNLEGMDVPEIGPRWPGGSRRNHTFSNLQAVNFENNRIGGTFPFWMAGLPMLEVVNFVWNEFVIDTNTPDALISSNDAQRSLRDKCESQGVTCTGIPHNGGDCFAFGPNTVILRPLDEICHVCEEPDNVFNRWVVLSVVVAGVVCLYVIGMYLNARDIQGSTFSNKNKPAHMGARRDLRSAKDLMINSALNATEGSTLKGWAACTVVIILHLQIISLIHGVRPIWPKNVQTFMGVCRNLLQN